MNNQPPEEATGTAARSVQRIIVDRGAEPADWQEIFDRLERRSKRFSPALHKTAAAAATVGGLFGVAGLMALFATNMLPDASPYLLALFMIPPGLLAGAASGQAGGNFFLHRWYGLDKETRRGFATRLTLARAPKHWPNELIRWLFTGDWLGSPAYDVRLPYLRLFIKGTPPLTCREENALWKEVHQLVAGDGGWEAGSNYREISYPRQIPAWAKTLEAGDGLNELQKRIGMRPAEDWVRHLWHRACKQWPGLARSGLSPSNRRECFEIHSLILTGGREALAVVLRPASFVAEFAEAGGARRAA